jgi:SAM-dependent methyltransferase
MTPFLLDYIVDPETQAPLTLIDSVTDRDGNILSGELAAENGRRYPIINGIPRFIDAVSTNTVESFGDEWNFFNFTDFKVNWLEHTVQNTFGSTDAFKGKLIVDAGGGSGAQTKWFAEYGASHVILMDLSHSVEEVVQQNLVGLQNVDVIQCSIDNPPLQKQSIDGIVYCHNVIQHTPSVERTAQALFELLADGGEFVFNCYPLNDQGLLRWIRFHLVYSPLRFVLSKLPFRVILAYATLMAICRLIPGMGWLFEKSGLCVQGDVPHICAETVFQRLKRRFKATRLNTYDNFGAHSYQHVKSDDEIRALVNDLQPDQAKVLNTEQYFSRPQPIGCGLRLFR